MALSIVTNGAANAAIRNLTINDSKTANTITRLSSGARVNSAKDDAAALAVGAKLRAEVASLRTAAVNAGQAVSMLQIADGALATVDNILVRMKTLAVQAASGQLSSTERGFLDNEYQGLLAEIDRISNDTEFNGVKLLSGGNTTGLTGIGTELTNATGIVAIKFGLGAPIDASATDSGTAETFSITFTSNTSSSLGVFSIGDGEALQTFTFDGVAIAGGATRDVFFSDFDVTITLGSAFSTAADLSVAADTTLGAFTTAGTSLTLTFKVGTGTVTTEDDLAFTLDATTASDLGIAAGQTSFAGSDLLGSTATNANAAIDDLNDVITKLAEFRAKVGSSQNRLEFAAANIAISTENAEAARSQLLDADIAVEITRFTSQQILVQAGVSALAQANQLPQNLLRLFQ